MDASTSTTAATVPPAHLNLQFWDILYQGKKDDWTGEKKDNELFNGKTGLAYPDVWKITDCAVHVVCRERTPCRWY
jgi:hypothetical protein